ncbi:MAG: hypothetical protein ACAI44_09685, partial [Candidatus Sericytochromatia bacterium]
ASLRSHLDAGQLVLKDKTPQGLKQELSRYLTAESPIWPLIREVRISGPFTPLQDGLELLDLPGLNDPNPVREAITRRHLKQAEFLWLIFGTGRGLTREVIELMKDQAFLNQIVLDGKVSALAFIGTRADDFVPELERAALQLPEDAGIDTIRQARELMIRQQIQQQLSELTLWFGNRYKVSPQASEILGLIARTLQQSPIHLSSALSWLASAGWLSRGSGRFEKPEQSGIPQLQEYMQQIVSEQGLKARKKLIRSQFQQMNQEIRQLIESMRQRQALRALAPQQGADLQLQLADLRQEQLKSLGQIEAELEQNLRLKQIQFEKQLLYAFSDLQHRLDQLQSRWQELNWQHLLRAVKSGGHYSSPRTGTHLDLVRDVQSFVETEVALDWYDFFQHRLLKEIDQGHMLVSGLLAQSCQLAQRLASDHPELQPRFASLGSQGVDILREQTFRSRREFEALLRELQRQIGTLLETTLRSELEPIFAQAAGFSGTGLKGQILEALINGINQALPEMGKVFQQHLTQMLQQLSAGIEQHQQELSQVLKEQLERLMAAGAA